MREARSQDGQPANSRGGRMPLLVSPDHAPIFLDLLFTLLTSNVSAGSYSKGFDLLKSLKQQVPALNTAGGEAMDTANASLDPSASVLNDSARTALGLAENGEAVDEYLEYSGRSKVNLTLLKLDLDLSPVFPSLEAVSADVQVFLIFVYSLAAVLSLVGNVTVILVLAFGRRSSVRCYLINLAVSDITMATFCIPFSYTRYSNRLDFSN
ncbi:prolactin-releasing peptide receptor-like [Cherax quadricarinatus]